MFAGIAVVFQVCSMSFCIESPKTTFCVEIFQHQYEQIETAEVLIAKVKLSNYYRY